MGPTPVELTSQPLKGPTPVELTSQPLMGPTPVELTSQPLKAVRAHVRRFAFDSLTSDQWWVEGEARNLGIVLMAEKAN